MKTTVILLLLVLSVMFWIDDVAPFLVWPLGAARDVTVEFGPKRDVGYQVPASIYRQWFVDMSTVDRIDCGDYCSRRVGIRFVAYNKVYSGYVCAPHGMRVSSGAAVYEFEMSSSFYDVCFSTRGLGIVVPLVSEQVTEALFTESNIGLSGDIYALLTEPLTVHGAPIAVHEYEQGIFTVVFEHEILGELLGTRTFKVDLVAETVADRTRAQCGNR